MELEKQVISLSLAKKLKELGVKQYSQFYWVNYNWKAKDMFWHLRSWDVLRKEIFDHAEHIPGFDAEQPQMFVQSYFEHYHEQPLVFAAHTSTELGDMLPFQCAFGKYENGWYADFYKDHKKVKGVIDETEAESRGLLLHYLIKNNLLKEITNETSL